MLFFMNNINQSLFSEEKHNYETENIFYCIFNCNYFNAIF